MPKNNSLDSRERHQSVLIVKLPGEKKDKDKRRDRLTTLHLAPVFI